MFSSENLRLSMARLPLFLQRPLTWLTGKPLPDQKPLFRWTPMTRMSAGIGVLSLGLTASSAAWAMGGLGWLLFPPGLLLTTGGLRALYLEIAHNAVHHWFGKQMWVNRLVTELFTTITFMNGYDVFRREHVQKHHGRNGTLDDPDYQALMAWGMVPGLPAATLRSRARWLPFNLRAHLGYLLARFRANFREGPAYRRVAAGALHGGVLAATAMTGAWLPVALVWWLPLIWGFQTSSMLQMIAGEHAWGLDLPPGKERIQQLSYGRFLGDRYPERGLLSKARWWLRVVTLHLPARLAVFTGNDIGPAHDVHHRMPGFDWANAAYAREELLLQGRLPGTTDVWGSLSGLVEYTVRGMAGRPMPPRS